MANNRYVLVEEEFQLQVLKELKELKEIIQSKNTDNKKIADDLMDTADAIAYLKTTRRTLFKYRQNGMPYMQLDNGKIYYRKNEIDSFFSNAKK